MTRLVRTGECNNCGECCGSNGCDNPWRVVPGVMSWQEEARLERVPHLVLLPAGVIDENGWHKEGSSECPFLADDNGDGRRLCSLVGTDNEYLFRNVCQENRNGEGYPRLVYYSYEALNDWMVEYPSCSFVYVEEAD